jgi:glycosidase
MLLLTLRGTPTLYYADELGLSDVAVPVAQLQDPRELREPGLGLGRDPVRTPMPWDSGPNAGFSTVRPWLPINTDWPRRNVALMAQEPRSILTLYQQLLALRRTQLPLSVGDFALLPGAKNDVLAYERCHGSQRVIVALNLGRLPQRVELPDWAGAGKLLLSTVGDAAMVESNVLLLRENEGVILAAGQERQEGC